MCLGELNTESGQLESPNFPAAYQPSKECIWKIRCIVLQIRNRGDSPFFEIGGVWIRFFSSQNNHFNRLYTLGFRSMFFFRDWSRIRSTFLRRVVSATLANMHSVNVNLRLHNLATLTRLFNILNKLRFYHFSLLQRTVKWRWNGAPDCFHWIFSFIPIRSYQ